MPANSPDNDREAPPGTDQAPLLRPAAAHNMPPNAASEADEVTLSDEGEGKGASPDLLDS